MSEASTPIPEDAPHVVTSASCGTASLGMLLRARTAEISALVEKYGAVLFRGFSVDAPSDFQDAVEALHAPAMRYTYRSTPRNNVDRDVFTATEYPKSLEIPLHCENAYQRTWPLWVAFCCLKPAVLGGQTPIARMRTVTTALPPALVDSFSRRRVRYIRHYRPFVDLPWQTVFQTEDRSDVERYCFEHSIDYTWLDQETLRTEQVCQGVAQHPASGETIFFNQAHLFQPSALEPKAMANLVEYFGADRLPRNATYGDGGEIAPSDLKLIRAAYSDAAIEIDWRKGDVALLDNMQFAHGRRAFEGDRQVLASLLRSYSAPEGDGGGRLDACAVSDRHDAGGAEHPVANRQ